METFISYPFTKWRFEGYQYKSDLIDFDGEPLLVHYQYGNRHAIYYWVEGDENNNRWLCFEVTVKQLYDYVHRKLTLFQLIKNKEPETFYTVDIDRKLNYSNFQFLPGYDIPQKYFPDVESYFLEDKPDYLQEIFNTIDTDYYLEILNDDHSMALEIIPNNSILPSNTRYNGTVSLGNGAQFLQKIDDSYKGYVGVEFYNNFSKDFQDDKSLSKTITKIILSSEPRILNTHKNGSFQITVGYDTVLKQEKMKGEYFDFRNTLPEKYKSEILSLSLNLNNKDVITDITKKYNDAARKKIFDPLIKIINSPEYNLSLINRDTNESKKYPKINYQNRKKLVPPIQKEPLPEQLEAIFATVTMEVTANTKLESLSKKDLKQGNLFIDYSNQIQREIQKIENDNYIIWLHKPVTYTLRINGTLREVIFEPLNINVSAGSNNNALEKFVDEFISCVELNYISETPKSAEIKSYFDTIIEEIEEKAPDIS
ncbi:MAG TPA: hypothetical protein VJY62_00010 [Bacteroidia bacterium]|nr:hypothetical protein [Bacteroidia bacterium]